MRGKNTKKRNKLVDAGSDATRQPGEAACQREREDGLGADASQTDRQLTRTMDPNESDSKVTTQRFALAFDKYGSTTVVVLSVFFPGPVKAPHDLSLWNFSDLLDYKAMLKLNSCACPCRGLKLACSIVVTNWFSPSLPSAQGVHVPGRVVLHAR
jgi:hypothetical protein